MLPRTKSLPVPRRAPAIAVEVRVPTLGTWFAAIAGTYCDDGIFLSTYQEVPAGTRVEVEIGLPGARSVVVDGVVGQHPSEGIGIHVGFEDLDDATRAELASLVPPSDVRARVA